MLIHKAIEHYLRFVEFERGLSENTIAAYRRDLNLYQDFLQTRLVADTDAISTTLVSEFVQWLATRDERPLGKSSQSRILSSVKNFHRFLVEESLAPLDVAEAVSPPKLAQKLPKAITIEQMSALLKATEGDDVVRIRDRALLELLYATGARISEVVSLNVDDTTFAEDGIRVRGKGGKQRIVPMGSYAKTALDEYLVRVRPEFSAKGRSTPALFLGPRGARVSRQMAWLIIQETAERANIGVEISPHTFRHSFATHLLSGGADVRVVQELLGHSSVATTQIYTKVTVETLRDSYITAHPRAR